VGGVIATVVMEAIVIFFGAGGILLGLFLLYAIVGIISGERIDGLGTP
jgi:hypothetical protein